VRFDTIIVPRGAEARAVEQGWPGTRPERISIPAGGAARTALQTRALGECALVFGLCGAIDPALRVGDAVVYSRIVDGAQTIELDAHLAAACARACASTPIVAASVPVVVGGVASKAALRAQTGAAVIDMEAAAVAHALEARGVRVAMVRIVSDDALHELPDLTNAFDAAGALRPIALALAFARAPLRGARFITNALRALRALRATAARLAGDLARERSD
jgi:nucleoside phosphorylase